MVDENQKAELDKLLAEKRITQYQYDKKLAGTYESPALGRSQPDRLRVDADVATYIWTGVLAMIIGTVIAGVALEGGSALGIVAGSAVVIVGALAIGVAVVAIGVRIGTTQAYAKMGLIPDDHHPTGG